MNIMQMHQIRFYLIEFSKQLLCSLFTMKTRPTNHSGFKYVNLYAKIGTKFELVFILSFTTTTPHAPRLMTFGDVALVIL